MPAPRAKSLLTMKSEKGSVSKRISLVLAVLCAVVMAAVLLIVLAFSDSKTNPFDYPFSLPMFVSAFLAFAGVVLLLIAGIARRGRPWRSPIGTFLVLDAAFLFIQLVVAHSIAYHNIWDPGTVADYAVAVASGEDAEMFEWYFSLFPNNNFIATLFVWLARLSILLGVPPLSMMVSVNVLLVNLAGLLLWLAVKLQSDSWKIAYLAWAIFSVLGGLSFWISTPYTDTFLLPFISGTLLSAVMIWNADTSRKRIAAIAICSTCLFLGSLIKPTILVAAVALSMVALLCIPSSRCGWRQWGKALVAFALPAVLCLGILPTVIEDSFPIDVDKSQAMSATHYLMMGANPNEYGVFSFPDYEISRGIEEPAERQKVNLEVFADRMRGFGFAGFLKFEAKKASFVYGDGTFHALASGEGQTFSEENLHAAPFGVVSERLRDLYYYQDGSEFNIARELDQILWMGILILMPLSLGEYLRQRRGQGGWVILFSMLFYAGVFVFLMMFETRSRYLYCFLPLFCFLAVTGLKWLSCYAYSHREFLTRPFSRRITKKKELSDEI